MKAAEIAQRVKLELDKQVHLKKKIAEGYYFCPRTNKNGVKHGSKYVKREGHSFFCIGKDKSGEVCFYHFHHDKANK